MTDLRRLDVSKMPNENSQVPELRPPLPEAAFGLENSVQKKNAHFPAEVANDTPVMPLLPLQLLLSESTQPSALTIIEAITSQTKYPSRSTSIESVVGKFQILPVSEDYQIVSSSRSLAPRSGSFDLVKGMSSKRLEPQNFGDSITESSRAAINPSDEIGMREEKDEVHIVSCSSSNDEGFPSSFEKFCFTQPLAVLQDKTQELPGDLLSNHSGDTLVGSEDEALVLGESTFLHPEFRQKAEQRDRRYNEFLGCSSSTTTLKMEDFQGCVARTAAKMSKNFHFAAFQSHWSTDSSETESCDMSELSWNAHEPEIWSVVAQGKTTFSHATVAPSILRDLKYPFTIHPQMTFFDWQDSVLEKTKLIRSETYLIDLKRPCNKYGKAPRQPQWSTQNFVKRSRKQTPVRLSNHKSQVGNSATFKPRIDIAGELATQFNHGATAIVAIPVPKIIQTKGKGIDNTMRMDGAKIAAKNKAEHLSPNNSSQFVSPALRSYQNGVGLEIEVPDKDVWQVVGRKGRHKPKLGPPNGFSMANAEYQKFQVSNASRMAVVPPTGQPKFCQGPIPTTSVTVDFPATGLKRQMRIEYKTKMDAVAAIYRSHGDYGYSNYYLFDRKSQTIYLELRNDSPPPESRYDFNRSQDLDLVFLPMQQEALLLPVALEDIPKSPKSSNGQGEELQWQGVVESTQRWCNDNRPQMVENLDAIKSAGRQRWNRDLPRSLFAPRQDRVKGDLLSCGNPTTDLMTITQLSRSIQEHSIDNGSISDKFDFQSCLAPPTPEPSIAWSEEDYFEPVDHDEILLKQLKDAQPEETRPSKTWVDLKRDFFNKYAPYPDFTHATRAEIAVYNAAAIKDGSHNVTQRKTIEPPLACKWYRDRDQHNKVKFHQIEDIARYESDQELLLKAARLSFAVETTVMAKQNKINAGSSSLTPSTEDITNSVLKSGGAHYPSVLNFDSSEIEDGSELNKLGLGFLKENCDVRLCTNFVEGDKIRLGESNSKGQLTSSKTNRESKVCVDSARTVIQPPLKLMKLMPRTPPTSIGTEEQETNLMGNILKSKLPFRPQHQLFTKANLMLSLDEHEQIKVRVIGEPGRHRGLTEHDSALIWTPTAGVVSPPQRRALRDEIQQGSSSSDTEARCLGQRPDISEHSYFDIDNEADNSNSDDNCGDSEIYHADRSSATSPTSALELEMPHLVEEELQFLPATSVQSSVDLILDDSPVVSYSLILSGRKTMSSSMSQLPPLQSEADIFLPIRDPYPPPYWNSTLQNTERSPSVCSEAITEVSEDFGVKLHRHPCAESCSKNTNTYLEALGLDQKHEKFNDELLWG